LPGGQAPGQRRHPQRRWSRLLRPLLSLAKTCRKLGIGFWDYLGDRLGVVAGPTIPHLPDIIRCREASA
jgi:hypothetical protein